MNRFSVKECLHNYKKNIISIEEVYKFKKIVLFGAGQSSNMTVKFLKGKDIICFFDNDASKWGKKINGYTVYPPAEIPNIVSCDTAIIISAVSQQYEIAKKLIDKYNVYQDNIFSYTNEYCEKYIYNTDKIIENICKIENLIDLLDDNNSKEYVMNTILNRLTRNPIYLRKNMNIISPYEYADKIVLNKGDSIIDCGAYTGDTAEIFLRKLDGECRVYCVEPFRESYDKLVENIKLKGISDRVGCFNFAVSDKKTVDLIRCNEEEVHMSANLRNSCGKLWNKINIDRVDNIFSDIDKVDFIKMDIEGEEVKALLGAENIIKKFKPRMMISAYHLIEHVWEIPQLIKKIEPNYKIYAGHQPYAPFEIEFYVTM